MYMYMYESCSGECALVQGSVRVCGALAVERPQFCTGPSMCIHTFGVQPSMSIIISV